jgi:hypothetical protein
MSIGRENGFLMNQKATEVYKEDLDTLTINKQRFKRQ